MNALLWIEDLDFHEPKTESRSSDWFRCPNNFVEDDRFHALSLTQRLVLLVVRGNCSKTMCPVAPFNIARVCFELRLNEAEVREALQCFASEDLIKIHGDAAAKIIRDNYWTDRNARIAAAEAKKKSKQKRDDSDQDSSNAGNKADQNKKDSGAKPDPDPGDDRSIFDPNSIENGSKSDPETAPNVTERNVTERNVTAVNTPLAPQKSGRGRPRSESREVEREARARERELNAGTNEIMLQLMASTTATGVKTYADLGIGDLATRFLAKRFGASGHRGFWHDLKEKRDQGQDESFLKELRLEAKAFVEQAGKATPKEETHAH